MSMTFDSLSTLEMVRVMNRQDVLVPLAVAEVLPQIAQAVDVIAESLMAGGRLFYQGTGTSGRLAVLDAVELLPTFRIDPQQVIALLAGGDKAMMQSVEGAEDDEGQGQQDLHHHTFSKGDVLVAIAASGRTPYALGGLRYATTVGAPSVALVCNPNSPMSRVAQIAIEVVTGPEILTGSTRLKAGTAQKLVLNMLSTCVMAKLGKIHDNLMVDVKPANAKLRQRAIRIVVEITGEEPATAEAYLERAAWEVKTAIVMLLMGIDAEPARQRLAAGHGHIRKALI